MNFGKSVEARRKRIAKLKSMYRTIQETVRCTNVSLYREISHELSRYYNVVSWGWHRARVEEAFVEVAGTRRRVNGRESQGFDVISCLRCVVAGVRYIGPNDRPRRAAAVRDPHTPRFRSFYFKFATLLTLFRTMPQATRLSIAFRDGWLRRTTSVVVTTENFRTRVL